MVIPAEQNASPALHIARVPGELGPIVRCSGELTIATSEALKRQLDLLISLDVPVLVLSVAGCRWLDTDGVFLLFDTYTRLREKGSRFAVVAGTDTAARILHLLAVDTIIPVFPSETSAAIALRGGGPPQEPPPTWSSARANSLALWRSILQALEDGSVEDIARRITVSHGLCQRAQALYQVSGARSSTRCEACPLFDALGAQSEDVGCGSITQPMLNALLAGDRATARAQVSRLIQILEVMPLAEKSCGPR